MCIFIMLIFQTLLLDGDKICCIILILILIRINVSLDWYIDSIRQRYLFKKEKDFIADEKKQLLLKYPIYMLFKNSTGNRTKEEWKELSRVLDIVYDGFTEKLCGIHNFTDLEFRICLLIKMEFAPADMARLTNHSRESISATRRRLYEKVFKRKGKPKLWDKFIMDL